MLTDTEEDDARKILGYFFGLHAESWNINESVVEKIGQMLLGESKCATVFDLTPRPGLVDKGYIKRQLRGIARRIISGGHSYDTCRLTVKYKWERVIQMASMGID